MRTLLWFPHAPLDLPGYRTTQVGMANALHSLGWKVVFVAKQYDCGRYEEEGFKGEIRWVKPCGSWWKTERKVAETLRLTFEEIAPDALIFEPPGVRYLLGAFRGKRLPPFCSLVVDVRTPPVARGMITSLIHWSNWLAGLAFARARAAGFTAISDPLAELIKRLVGSALPHVVWSSGVDVSEFDPSHVVPVHLALPGSRGTVFLYHGSIQRDRGVSQMIEAFCEVRRAGSDACLVILGGSEEDHHWMTEVFKAGGGREGLSLLPMVENRQVPSVVAAADIGVCPLPDVWKWRVSSPIKIFEYLAMGKPVVATDITAHRSILGRTSDHILCEPTVGGLACAMLEADRRIRTEAWSGRNREAAMRFFSWSNQAANVARFLDVLGQANSPAAGARR